MGAVDCIISVDFWNVHLLALEGALWNTANGGGETGSFVYKPFLNLLQKIDWLEFGPEDL